jgi:hypothetical protein
VAPVREKKTIKKTKVHKALKVHTSNDSGEISKPKENPAPEKKTLVEKDQHINVAEDRVSGPKDDPKPQPEPLVEDQNASNEEQQENVQNDGTILKQDAPNSERKNDSLTNPEVEDREVYLVLFSNFIFFE